MRILYCLSHQGSLGFPKFSFWAVIEAYCTCNLCLGHSVTRVRLEGQGGPGHCELMLLALMWAVKSFTSDPGISVFCWHPWNWLAKLLACKQDEITDASQFFATVNSFIVFLVLFRNISDLGLAFVSVFFLSWKTLVRFTKKSTPWFPWFSCQWYGTGPEAHCEHHATECDAVLSKNR